MADYTRRDITTTRRIYVLPSPTNWVEVEKVLSALKQDKERQKVGTFDDTVTVEAFDDEIHFSFEIERQSAGS